MLRPEFDLARTLRPVAPDAFIAEHWERAPLLIARDDPVYYAPLLPPAEVESLVAAAGPAEAPVELLGEERGRGAPDGPSGSALDRYRRGATIRLKGIQRRCPPLRALCRDLERALGVTAVANLYWTPPGSQALPAHWDGHDVLVLQIAGSKRWRVYDAPMALPTDLLPSFGFERARPPVPPGWFRHWTADPGPAAFGPEAPAHEIELRAGDLLYLPRGHGHEARTGQTLSIHVTLGLYAVTWADLLCLAVHQVAQTDVRFRRALPPGFVGAAEAGLVARAEFTELAAAFNEAARDPAAADRAFAELAERFVLGAPSVNAEPAADPEGTAIDLHTVLRQRPGLLARLRVAADGITLFYSGRWFRGPAAFEAPLRFILAASTFTPACLPGSLDAESRVLLARRLVREGFLKVVPRPRPGDPPHTA
jgi:ribosomal protein L16 Arg81 hydroxylase